MAFTAPPAESKSNLNKAGEILISNAATPAEHQWAEERANQWRACHAYPINTFKVNLWKKLKKLPGNPIAAQRLKRMPTIIDKLKRYPSMKLTTMQDIGGVRAIVSSVKDVQALVKKFKESKYFIHELINEKDYVNNPRDEDGYRSHHLIYRYRNPQVPQYDGLRLELQIRTKLQHTWAMAVETMGSFLGQALKSRQGDQEWLDFFAIASSAFAHKEKAPPVPRFAHLSEEETFKQLASAETQLLALTKMAGFTAAVDHIGKSKGGGKSWSYHLIILNSQARTVGVQPYDRDSVKQAIADYNAAEARAKAGEKIEPVLVSAGPLDKLRKAYPSFFLDTEEFVKAVTAITGPRPISNAAAAEKKV